MKFPHQWTLLQISLIITMRRSSRNISDVVKCLLDEMTDDLTKVDRTGRQSCRSGSVAVLELLAVVSGCWVFWMSLVLVSDSQDKPRCNVDAAWTQSHIKRWVHCSSCCVVMVMVVIGYCCQSCLSFGLSLTECRYIHILSTCYDRYLNWKNLCVNKNCLGLTLFIHKTTCCLWLNLLCFCVLWFPKVRQLH